MSQNLDATAINQIHALISAQGVNEIISKIGADAVALPENLVVSVPCNHPLATPIGSVIDQISMPF
ncbi:hypothetical protein FG789_025170 [Salmonella enterica subsp. enterica serovar Derby]|nr:hypothetical protein FG789_025170 [Salmonella enterica subsp. enterica serovar Derby]